MQPECSCLAKPTSLPPQWHSSAKPKSLPSQLPAHTSFQSWNSLSSTENGKQRDLIFKKAAGVFTRIWCLMAPPQLPVKLPKIFS